MASSEQEAKRTDKRKRTWGRTGVRVDRMLLRLWLLESSSSDDYSRLVPVPSSSSVQAECILIFSCAHAHAMHPVPIQLCSQGNILLAPGDPGPLRRTSRAHRQSPRGTSELCGLRSACCALRLSASPPPQLLAHEQTRHRPFRAWSASLRCRPPLVWHLA